MDGWGRKMQSLPSRERGLKSQTGSSAGRRRSGSLPSRERGLKFDTPDFVCYHAKSLPARERGLKYAVSTRLEVFNRRSLRGGVD